MGRPDRTGVPGGGTVLAAVGLLVATAAAASFASLDLRRTADREPAESAPAGGDRVEFQSGGLPQPSDESTLLDQVALVALVLAALVLVLAVGWALLRRRGWRWAAHGWYRLRSLRSARGGLPDEPDRAALLAAVDEAVARSEHDSDPRRAVIACWVRLEEAAGAAGTPRRDSDTSTDLVLRLLREHRVSEPVLAAFAEVYRPARYGAHTVDEEVRTQARSALHRLRAELRPEASNEAGGGWRPAALPQRADRQGSGLMPARSRRFEGRRTDVWERGSV